MQYYEKYSSEYVNFLTGSDLWMILIFLFLHESFYFTFFDQHDWPFYSIRKQWLASCSLCVDFWIQKQILINYCQKILSTFPLFSCSFQSSSSTENAAFHAYVFRHLHIFSDLSDPSNEVNYLKCQAISRRYNLSMTTKSLNKFKNLNCLVCHWKEICGNFVVLLFYSTISFKISKILSHFGFNVCFKLVSKIKLSALKDPIPSENWWGIIFTSCSSCDLGYIDQTKRRLKCKLPVLSKPLLNHTQFVKNLSKLAPLQSKTYKIYFEKSLAW